MRIRSSGLGKPSIFLKLLQRILTAPKGSTQIDVIDNDDQYSFLCDNLLTLRRATTLLVKEPGTIRWLREQAQPGRVFLDIGANVGVYSIFAGHHVGIDGQVYAVEPHLRNAVALMDNIMLNKLSDRISVLALALSREASVIDFNYGDWATGSSHNQLQNGDAITMGDTPVASELKAASSVDILIANKTMRTPDFVKIDVDGIELAILEGATELLGGANRPRSLQVEVESGNYKQIDEFMSDHGWDLKERHATMAGTKRMKRGAAIEDLAHNVIYEPRALH